MGSSRSWLRSLLRPFWPQYRALVQYSLFINILALATPIFVLQVYDRVVFHSGLSTLQGLAIGMVIVVLFDFLMRQARSKLMQHVSIHIDAALGRRLFDKLTALPLRVLEAHPASYWQAAFRDIDHIRNMLGGPTAVLVVDIPFVILFIGLIYIIAAPVVWVLVIALVVFALLAWWSSGSVQRASLEERNASQKRDALLAEIVAARTTVKALAVDEALRPVWEDRHAESIESALHRGTRADLFGNLGIVMTIATTVAMTVVGALAILDQLMTIGALIAANMLSARIITPLNQLVVAWRGFATYREARNRISDVLDMPEERSESGIEFDRPAGIVTVEQVRFGFAPDAEPTISDLSFSLRPGGIHGVIGRNGSGKSTLLKLIQGLYAPDSGRVLIDDADIQQFTRRDLARWFGYVPQDCFLFAGTIAENICKSLPEAAHEVVLEISRKVGLHEDVVALPDGYDTDIGEAGVRLSAGQRQKIMIARALLRDPPVLLLDEPTSNLDHPAEEQLKLVLQSLAKDHNIIIITHSPSLLTACDNLLVMNKGKIAMAGKAAEILPRLSGKPQIVPQPGVAS